MRGTLQERFAAKWEPSPSGCWEWTGGKSNGYGVICAPASEGGGVLRAYRVSYEWFFGPIPDGLVIDHLCRNPACVHPLHLEAVTMRENTLRGISPMARFAQRTHCDHGHEFTPENTYIRTDGRSPARKCRTCRNETNQRWKARNREAYLAKAREYTHKRYWQQKESA